MEYKNPFMEQMEAFFVKSMQDMVTNAKSVENLTKGIEAGLETRHRTDHNVKLFLESWNLPTRDDVARILQTLQALESRLIGLEEKLEDLSDSLKPASAQEEPAAAQPRPAKPKNQHRKPKR